MNCIHPECNKPIRPMTQKELDRDGLSGLHYVHNHSGLAFCNNMVDVAQAEVIDEMELLFNPPKLIIVRKMDEGE